MFNIPDGVAPYAYCKVYLLLKEFQRLNGGYVRSTLLADHLALPQRTTRLYLAQLESVGLVSRRGRRGGWRVK